MADHFHTQFLSDSHVVYTVDLSDERDMKRFIYSKIAHFQFINSSVWSSTPSQKEKMKSNTRVTYMRCCINTGVFKYAYGTWIATISSIVDMLCDLNKRIPNNNSRWIFYGKKICKIKCWIKSKLSQKQMCINAHDCETIFLRFCCIFAWNKNK